MSYGRSTENLGQNVTSRTFHKEFHLFNQENSLWRYC